MATEIRDIEPIHVVGMKHSGPYHGIGDTFEKILGKADAAGWPMQGCLGIYYDDPTEVAEEELRSAACIITPEGFDPDDKAVEAFSVDGGKYAVMRHVGPYEKLPDAWMKFYSEELPKLGMDDAGPPYERYVNHPDTTPAEELITDLHIPVKPR
ncbi:MAG: GyrI-like domain-containing protein [Armatimonadetes bacterium]|nr:GyrI-like domain-containing protein [Armatimonadota bacterium]